MYIYIDYYFSIASTKNCEKYCSDEVAEYMMTTVIVKVLQNIHPVITEATNFLAWIQLWAITQGELFWQTILRM